MPKKKQIHSYNDGIVRLYRKKTEKSVKGMEDLEYLSKLPFDEKTLRQEDVEFALQNDAKLSVKIATPDDGNDDTKRVAVIGNIIYAIIRIDRDRSENELYFHLEEVRKVAD